MILSAPLRSVGLIAFAMFLFCTSAYAQNDMRLFYNINTGNVQVEIINPMIELFSIETIGPANSAGTGFLLFNNVDSSTVVGAPIVTPPANQDTIAFNNTIPNQNTPNPFPVGTVNLGNIMPPGITFASTDATDTLSLGTNSSGPVGFGALAFTITGAPGNPGDSLQVAFEAVTTTAVCGDINLDGSVTFLDIAPFITLLSTGGFQAEADCDLSGMVTFLDIAPFIAALAGN